MANEIRLVDRTEFARGSVLSRPARPQQYAIATTSELVSDAVQVVGTTHEAIEPGDVTDSAFCRIENLSATAVVTVGGDASTVFVPWFSIPPGGPPATLPIVESLSDTYLKSDTASTPVRVTLIKVVAPA
jgi:hypothetical protein